MSKPNPKKLSLVITVASAILFSQTVLARDAAIIEEVIVTAQKRQQSSQDVSISVTAFSGDDLKELNITDPIELSRVTAGLESKPTAGSQNPIFSIRGIGLQTATSNVSPSAVIHIDEVYMATPAYSSFNMFDLERVEVLKGPQGTLFGRNATAGTISFITRKPTDQFEALTDISYGSFNAIDALGVVSGPLADGLNGRLAVSISNSDGHQNNLGNQNSSGGISASPNVPVNPVVLNSDWGGMDSIAWRGSLSWDASDNLSLVGNIHGSRDRSENWVQRQAEPDAVGYSLISDDPRDVESNVTPEIDADKWGAFLKVEWDLGVATLTSVTGYEQIERTMELDDGSPFRILEPVLENKSSEISQEIRLSSSGDSQLYWTVGGNWSTDTVEVFRNNSAADSAEGVILTTNYDRDVDASAIFAHAEWAFDEQWKIIGGVRFLQEELDYSLSSEWLDPFDSPFVFGFLTNIVFPDAPFTVDKDESYEAVTGKLGLDWTPTDDILVYVSASKGFKSGGFDGTGVTSLAETEPYDEETLWAYELGFKTTLADGQLQFNGATFFYDYDNVQAETAVITEVDGFTNTNFIITNAGKAEVYGAELELWWRPTDGLDIKGGVSVLETEITDFASDDLAEVAAVEGNELPDAPELTFNGLIRYQWDLANNLTMMAMTSVNYSDGTFKELDNIEKRATQSYTLWDARLALNSTNSGWGLALWGKNLTDEEYVTETALQFSSQALLEMYGMPRSVGVSASYRW